MRGGSHLRTVRRLWLPLEIPRLLTARVLTVFRAVARFDLTFLVANASSQTLVVALFGGAFAAGRYYAMQVIDALPVIYTLTTMTLLGIALVLVSWHRSLVP